MQRLRYVVILHFLTNTCEADNRQEPSQTRTEGVHESVSEGSDGLGIHCGQADTLLHEERTTHDGAVHRDQRQEDSEARIERRAVFLHNHLHQLHDSSNDGDEEDETEVLQVQRLENERLQQVVNRQGNCEHESNGYTQTG